MLLVLLTTGVMHHQVRQGFDEYVTSAKIQRLGKESVLVHMHQQMAVWMCCKSGAWADLLASGEAVRRDQFDADTPPVAQNRWGFQPDQPAPLRRCAAPRPWRADKAIASSVSIMLQARQEQTSQSR